MYDYWAGADLLILLVGTPQTKMLPQHAGPVELEPRNGVIFCATHHRMFGSYDLLIRYVPEVSLSLFACSSSTLFIGGLGSPVHSHL